MTAKEKMRSLIKEQTTDQLKEMAQQLKDNFEEGAGVSFVFVLDELEIRLPEKEYVEFCDTL